MDRETIGKIQIGFGILLLFVTLIGGYMVFDYGFDRFDSITTGIDHFASEEAEVRMDALSMQLQVGTTFLTAAYLFGVCVVILFALSVMFILQGLANMADN
jgi:hypothetical protein